MLSRQTGQARAPVPHPAGLTAERSNAKRSGEKIEGIFLNIQRESLVAVLLGLQSVRFMYLYGKYFNDKNRKVKGRSE